MRIIGITGGVGAGKSAILDYIKMHYNARIILADQVANDLKLPKGRCYEPLVALLGAEVVTEEGFIDKGKMAEIIFHDTEKLAKVNAMLHPAVRDYITEEIAKEQKSDKLDYLFIEAALLIEEHYDEIVDELWYVYADTETRRRRLKEKRGYSDDKIDNIMEKQLTDDVFREKCQFVIDNSDKLAYTYEQINGRMEE